VTIEQNLLSLAGSCRVAFKLSVNNRIVMVVRIQHLGLCSMFLEQSSEESGPTSAVLSMIWSRRYGLKRDKLIKRLYQLAIRHLRPIISSRIAASDVPYGDGIIVGSSDV